MSKSLCIYCASSQDIDEHYKQLAHTAGQLCALNGWSVITGAGSEGLMGAANTGCQQAGGKVTGIIPQWMIDRGWLQDGLDEVIVANDMAERKQKFRDLCDAILVLPGGYGTMEELFETLTQKQLGLFDKPIVILNHNKFYDHLIEWVHLCHSQHFLRHDSDLKLFTVICTPQEIFPALGVKQTTPN